MRKLLMLISFIPMVSLANPMPVPQGHQPPSCRKMNADHRSKPGPMMNKRSSFRIFTKLALSEPQLNEIKYIIDSAHVDVQLRMQKQRQLEHELETLATSLNYDDSAAHGLIAQIVDLKSVQLKQKTNTQQKIMDLLTNEQKVNLSLLQKIALLDKF